MKVLVYLLFIGGIVALGLMLGKGSPSRTITLGSPSPSSAMSSSSEATPSETTGQGGSAPTGRLIVLNESTEKTEVTSIDVVSKEKKIIYSDLKDKQKIRLVSDIPRDGDSLVAMVSNADDENLPGQLIAIKTDGNGKKTTLIDNFMATEPPAVSPDKTKLAMISFSNADPHYGFTLYTTDMTGKNRKDLTTDSGTISRPVFSPDGKQLAFIKGATTSDNQIATVNLDTKEVKTLYTTKGKVIEDYDWSPVGLFVATLAPSGQKAASQSEVFIYDPKSKDTAQITKNSQLEGSPHIAPDGSGIAYIERAEGKVINTGKPGSIKLSDSTGKNTIDLGTANRILGCIK